MSERKKRRNVVEEAVEGDLVVAVDSGAVTAIEAVVGDRTAENILTRWRDQGMTGVDTVTEIWQFMPDSYYRRRRLERKRRG